MNSVAGNESLFRRFQILLILIIPFIFYVGVTIHWSKEPYKGISGDEPHYLIIAKSIIQDFDFDLKNNYDHELANHELFNFGDRHAIDHNGKEYTVHFPGLGMLIALPYLLFGVTGVKIFMCIITAMTTLLGFIIFRRQVNNDFIAAWAAVGLTLALPFLGAANQIYCEVASGIVSCWSVLVLYRLIDRKPLSMATRIIWMICISFLIVMHIKNILIVFAISVIYLLILFFDFRRNPNDLKRIIKEGSVAFIPLIAALGILVYQKMTGGGSVQTHLIVIDIMQNVKRFLMFHFDRESGMFLQNPLYLVAAVGIIPFIMDSKVKVLVWLAVFMPVAILNSVVLTYFLDDGLLASRFMWAYCPMWLIPFGYGLKYLKDNFRPEIINTIITISILFQLNNFAKWIAMKSMAVNWHSGAMPIYDSILLYLPSFKLDNGNKIINILYLVGFALLVLQGSPIAKRKFFPATWAVYFLGFFAVVTTVTPKKMLMKDMYFDHRSMATSMGHVDTIRNEVFWIADEPKEGNVWFGPYQFFRKGTYEVLFSLEAEPLTPGYNGVLAQIDAASDYGKTVLNQRIISVGDPDIKSNNFMITIRVPEDILYMELRITKRAEALLRIKHLYVRNIDN